MPDGENTDEVKAKDARWPFVLPFLFVLGGIFGMARAAIFEAQRLVQVRGVWLLFNRDGPTPERPGKRKAPVKI
jgi:hypothetical protein